MFIFIHVCLTAHMYIRATQHVTNEWTKMEGKNLYICGIENLLELNPAKKTDEVFVFFIALFCTRY